MFVASDHLCSISGHCSLVCGWWYVCVCLQGVTGDFCIYLNFVFWSTSDFLCVSGSSVLFWFRVLVDRIQFPQFALTLYWMATVKLFEVCEK